MSLSQPSQVSATTGSDHHAPVASAGPCATRQAMTASRTTPTLCVLVIMTGPSRNPDSSTQVVPVISPFPFSVNQPANTGSTEFFPRGNTAVTPVRTGPVPTTNFPSPEIKVRYPTSTPFTSVIAFSGPGVPSNGTPKSRARTSRSDFPPCPRAIDAATISHRATSTEANTAFALRFFIPSSFPRKITLLKKRSSLRARRRMVQQPARLPQKLSILRELALQNLGLFFRHFPIARLGSLCQSRQLQMRIRITRCIQRMFEPRPPRNPRRVAPISFHLHQLLIHQRRRSRIQPPGRNRLRHRQIQFAPSRLKIGDSLLQRHQINMPAHVTRQIQVHHKLPDIFSIRIEIVRKHVRVRQTQRKHSPQLRHQSVIAITRIPKMIHPEKIIVHGMINAVRPRKRQAHGRNPQKIKENGMVRPAPNPRIRQLRVRHRLRQTQLRLPVN